MTRTFEVIKRNEERNISGTKNYWVTFGIRDQWHRTFTSSFQVQVNEGEYAELRLGDLYTLAMS